MADRVNSFAKMENDDKAGGKKGFITMNDCSDVKNPSRNKTGKKCGKPEE